METSGTGACRYPRDTAASVHTTSDILARGQYRKTVKPGTQPVAPANHRMDALPLSLTVSKVGAFAAKTLLLYFGVLYVCHERHGLF